MTEWQKSVETALRWIEDNLTEEFSLLELANQAGYSPFYFSRLFRSMVGMTSKNTLPTAACAGLRWR